MDARRRLAGAAATSLLVACSASAPCRLDLRDAEGRLRASFAVEVAATAAARRQGLSGRALSPGEGLLIALPAEIEVCIDNGAVDYPIDAAFVRMTGEVAALERNLPAGDATPRCHPATRWILETRAHALAELQVGDIADIPTCPHGTY